MDLGCGAAQFHFSTKAKPVAPPFSPENFTNPIQERERERERERPWMDPDLISAKVSFTRTVIIKAGELIDSDRTSPHLASQYM